MLKKSFTVVVRGKKFTISRLIPVATLIAIAVVHVIRPHDFQTPIEWYPTIFTIVMYCIVVLHLYREKNED